MIHLAIDPGVWGCGVALYQDEVLRRASYVLCKSDLDKYKNARYLTNNVRDWVVYAIAPNFNPKFTAYYVDTLTVELPQVYKGSLQKGDPNDLIDLSFVVGALASSLSYKALEIVKPQAWKGQMSKEVCHERTLNRLSDEEKANIDPNISASLKHNMLDAVGLGLYAVGRFERTRNYAK